MKNPVTTIGGIVLILGALTLFGLDAGGVITVDSVQLWSLLAGLAGLVGIVAKDPGRTPGSKMGPALALAALPTLLVASGSLIGGCAAPADGPVVGPEIALSDAAVSARNFVGSTSRMVDENGNWTLTTPNSSTAISTTADGFDAQKGGQITRDLSVRRGDLNFTLSSGSDIFTRASKLSYDPVTGSVSIEGFEFGTTLSEPTRASNEALDRWTAVVATLAPEQRAAIVAQIEAFTAQIDTITPELGDVIRGLLGGG